MYPITSIKCNMYKETVNIMISLTLYQVKHLSSRVHSDGCMRRLFSEGIFGIVSSAHSLSHQLSSSSESEEKNCQIVCHICFFIAHRKGHWTDIH